MTPVPSAGPSGAWSAARAWLGFALLVTAHFGIRPLITGRVTVDFLLIAVLFAAVRMRPGLAALVGFLAGIAVDALAPASFGAFALALSVVAFGASWVKAVFFADHVALTGLFVFAAKWLFDITHTFIQGRSSGAGLLVELLLWSPLSAALTAMVALVLVTAFRPLYRPQTL